VGKTRMCTLGSQQWEPHRRDQVAVEEVG